MQVNGSLFPQKLGQLATNTYKVEKKRQNSKLTQTSPESLASGNNMYTCAQEPQSP